MLKIRIIPILTFNGFALVKTRNFSSPRMIGNPVQAARVYNSRGVDELIFLDIFATRHQRKLNLSLIRDIINECLMPVAIGGGIRSLEDINSLLRLGADKVVIKNEAIHRSEFIKDSSNFFGSQCITISCDAIKFNGDYYVYDNGITSLKVVEFVQNMQNLGAGEIVLNSVDFDGTLKGFDLKLYQVVSEKITLPIVMVGGGGNLEHYKDLFLETNCEAVGSSSIFHFTQFTPYDIKKALQEIGKPVRIG